MITCDAVDCVVVDESCSPSEDLSALPAEDGFGAEGGFDDDFCFSGFSLDWISLTAFLGASTRFCLSGNPVSLACTRFCLFFSV